MLRGVGRVFGYAWRVLDGVRRVVHLVLMLLVLLVLVLIFAQRPGPLPDAFVLVLNPQGVLVEQYTGEPLERALEAAQGLEAGQVLVSELVQVIEDAAGDARVTAIHFELDGFQGGSLDKLERVAATLDRFRETGKPVVASGAYIGQPQLYLGAHADELYLDPAGAMFFQGYGFYRNYFREALDKLSIDWHVFSAGEAKSYGEPYVRNSMSAAARENMQPIADGMWAAWRAAVADARGLEPELLDDFANNILSRLRAAGGDLAQAALEAGLADGMRTIADLEQRLAETGGRDEDGDYVGVGADEYQAALQLTANVQGVEDDTPAVGLIVAQGDILPGYQPPGSIGDDSLRELLRAAADDEDIQAVVLRVDSGGGSALASEAILREIEMLRVAGKPVVVSMGGVAASGGYMISIAADEIWAHPTTVTGSIGVVAMLPNFGRLMDNVGVSVDGVGTHRYTGELRLDRPLADETKEAFEVMVEGVYVRFKGLVAEHRGLRGEQVQRYAEGRVWLGEVAQEAGLVDRLGTLDDALASAADMAGLGEDFRVETIEATPDFAERLMADFLSSAIRAGWVSWPSSWLERLPSSVRSVVADIERLGELSDPRNLYYHCFCDSF
ncbi:signal peptide peptidase SppA [Wenzhouxiangella sp. XN24]|uniref:signal peptide peptidase SppA n=1 Tax=Wenzhouxiangella sp. XN24 TaxID=2713569 RepID=UPI0013EC14B9|nr:signal peptide peptidase SppA [Wenzhouxiangella sp. XN24]NGX15470.1 signal peptide peptidase SppA [Wenzhouxiangella sp. XN24]